MSGNPYLWEFVEAAAAAVIPDTMTKQWEHKRFREETRNRLDDFDELPADVKDAALDLLAKHLTDRFVSRRKPRASEPDEMFHPSRVLPLGNGMRIWMADATASDLMAWAALEARNAARIMGAAGRRQEYVASRLTAMREHPGWSLGRIEREVFGYVLLEPDDYRDDEVEDGGDDDL